MKSQHHITITQGGLAASYELAISAFAQGTLGIPRPNDLLNKICVEKGAVDQFSQNKRNYYSISLSTSEDISGIENSARVALFLTPELAQELLEKLQFELNKKE